MGHSKRANGDGFCYKIDNNPNRKRPFVYGFITGWTSEGKPIKKILGYTTSKSKGNKELDKYLVSGEEKQDDITWKELYEKWIEYKKSTGISKEGLQHYTNAYRKTLILNNRKFSEINLEIMQNIISNSGVKTDGQKRIRNLYSQLYDYSKVLGVKINSNFSKFLVVSKEEKSEKHTTFTNEEINKLWENRNNFVDIILLMIYTGIRPNEIFKITESTNDYIVTGSKTTAGKNRIIPIHDDIKNIFKEILNNKTLELISTTKFYTLFNIEMNKLNMKHFPYDTRHTFSTLWKFSKADDLARKRIMGHSVKDLTDNVYTHLDFDFLKTELNKVKFNTKNNNHQMIS